MQELINLWEQLMRSTDQGLEANECGVSLWQEMINLWDLESGVQNQKDLEKLNQISRQLCVFKKLYMTYNHDWRKSEHSPPADDNAYIAAALIFLKHTVGLEKGPVSGLSVKNLNSAMYACDLVAKEKAICLDLKSAIQNKLDKLS